jgi:transposase
MGAPKKADWREERRKRAWELKQAGWNQKEIAEALGVTEGAVSQWMKSARAGGEEALKAHPAPGARPRLTAEQQAQIPAVLAKGAAAYGFAGEVWNSRRLAVALKREFGVSYHPDHCGYLVRSMGYSLQKPIERATQRNEQAIEDWKTQHWPRLKKKPNKNGAR